MWLVLRSKNELNRRKWGRRQVTSRAHASTTSASTPSASSFGFHYTVLRDHKVRNAAATPYSRVPRDLRNVRDTNQPPFLETAVVYASGF